MTNNIKNPLDKVKRLNQLSQEMINEYATIIEKLLTQIGYIFVGENRNVCAELSTKNMKRFKLFREHFSFGINLWYGTSKYITCEDLTFPKDDELYLYDDDSYGKAVYFSVSLNVALNPERKFFKLYIRDNMNILPSIYQKYEQKHSNFDEVVSVLTAITDALQEHPYNPFTN